MKGGFILEWKLKKFHELSSNELYSILKLRCEVFIVEQKCPYEDIDGKDIPSYHLFLEDNGVILSYLRIIPQGISFDEVSIGRVLVNSLYRKNGYGREMMNKAIDFVINDMKESSIKIGAQSYLKDFYKSIGFNEISQEFLEDDIPHIYMLYEKSSL